MIKCPDCFGDGIETCHNPDHGFIGYNGILGSVMEANEGRCPCCGYDENHKMKGVCQTCSGTGEVNKETYDKYIQEFVSDEEEEHINEICLL